MALGATSWVAHSGLSDKDSQHLGYKHTYPALTVHVTLFFILSQYASSPYSLYPANINLYNFIHDIVKKLESEYKLLNLLLLGNNSPLDTPF